MSHDNSVADVKNKYNVIKSLDGNPLAAAWASSDAKDALPAEPTDDGKVRRSEDVATATQLTLDHKGAPSKPDNNQAANAPAAEPLQ